MNSKQPAIGIGLILPRFAVNPVLVLVLAIAVYAFGLVWRDLMTTLADGWNDPDSMMRLHEVRDFLAGKGWYDTTETRLMPPIGMVSHWSRYVDAPLAALILLAEPFVGREAAELLVVNFWPRLLLFPFVLGLATLAHRFGGWRTVAFTTLIVALSPGLLSIFRPGDIDHHNVQAVLAVWMVAMLVRADTSRPAAALAGFFAASSLAIGMETLLMVLLSAGGLALAWVASPRRWRAAAVLFSTSMAVTTVVHFFATVPPGLRLVGACDAISITYVTLTAVGGGGMAAIAVLFASEDRSPASLLMRSGALAVLGCLIVAVTAVLYPQCLHGPYGQVDPRVMSDWMSKITEAQNVFQVAAGRLWTLPAFYAGNVIAALLGIVAILKLGERDRTAFGMLLAILVGSTLVGFIQLRAFIGANVFASVAGAVAAVCLIDATAERNDFRAVLMRSSWLLVLPVIWYLAGYPLRDRAAAAREDAGVASFAACLPPLRDLLNEQPAGLVAATSNVGSFLMMATDKDIVAAPYHRNAAGLLAANALFSATDGAREFADLGARYIAFCKDDPEMASFAAAHPDGLSGRLMRDDVPDWLTIAARSDRVVVLRPSPKLAMLAADPDVTGSLPGLGLRPSLGP